MLCHRDLISKKRGSNRFTYLLLKKTLSVAGGETVNNRFALLNATDIPDESLSYNKVQSNILTLASIISQRHSIAYTRLHVKGLTVF